MSTPPSETEWMFAKCGLRHYVLTCWLLKQRLKNKNEKCHLHIEIYDLSPFTMKPLWNPMTYKCHCMLYLYVLCILKKNPSLAGNCPVTYWWVYFKRFLKNIPVLIQKVPGKRRRHSPISGWTPRETAADTWSSGSVWPWGHCCRWGWTGARHRHRSWCSSGDWRKRGCWAENTPANADSNTRQGRFELQNLLLQHPLLRLSVLSRVWLLETPWTVARQAPLSKGFSRQEHWSGLSFSRPRDQTPCLLCLLHWRQVLYHQTTWLSSGQTLIASSWFPRGVLLGDVAGGSQQASILVRIRWDHGPQSFDVTNSFPLYFIFWLCPIAWSFPIRDRTCIPFIGGTESLPLDHQGNASSVF